MMNMDARFKQEVEYRLRGKPHLLPLFTSTHCIPERVHEYGDDLFIVYNSRTERFELHSLDNKGDTRCATLPYKTLDARVLEFVWKNDFRVHGRDIFRRMEAQEEREEKRRQREWKNWVESVAKETRTLFAKSAWDDTKVTF